MRNPYNTGNLDGTKNNNKEIKDRRRVEVENYIIDINNRLVQLADFLHLNIPELKKIPTHSERIREALNEQNKRHFTDVGKRAIIDSVLEDEKKDRLKEKVKKEAMEAAEIAVKESADSIAIGSSNRAGILEKKNNKGVPPPKVDWKREGLSKSEKDKIKKSIKANPKSSIFSNEFKWETKEFLKAFKFLESADKYNGPFIVSMVDERRDLEKYGNEKKLEQGVYDIFFGKYILLSVYDITASEDTPGESKHFYIGLKFLPFSGRVELDCIGSIYGDNVSSEQKMHVREYMDSMDILYDENHDDLS